MNLVKFFTDLFDRMFGERVFRAAVTGTSGNLVTIQRPGQPAADTQSYPRLVSYTSPTAGDEVVVMKLGGGWIILGEIIR